MFIALEVRVRTVEIMNMNFDNVTLDEMQKHEEMCEELSDKISGMCNYFRSVFAEVPCENMGIEKYSCRVELSFSTEKNYIYRNFEAKYLDDLLFAIRGDAPR